MRRYEANLPEGYQEIAHVTSNEMPDGFLSDLKAVWPGLFLAAVSLVSIPLARVIVSVGLFAVGIYPYFVFHELLHAAVYRVCTGRRTSIRFTKSGAFCALPEGYVSRSVSVLCTAAPLAGLGALFTAWAVYALRAKHWTALPASLLLALHLLACRSDVHLLRQLKKHRGSDVLVQDRGTEQWIFQK